MTEIATDGSGAPVPDPELVERPQRRSYNAQYKQRILEAADACKEPGEIGALLRREGLHTSHLTTGASSASRARWRRWGDGGAASRQIGAIARSPSCARATSGWRPS